MNWVTLLLDYAKPYVDAPGQAAVFHGFLPRKDD
jgi:hypothetical protein